MADLLRVPKVSLHVGAQCAVIFQNPVYALEIQDISLGVGQGFCEPRVAMPLEVHVNNGVHLTAVRCVLAHLLDQDLLVESQRHDERVVGGAEQLEVDLTERAEAQYSHTPHLVVNSTT